MTNQKTLKTENTILPQDSPIVEGVDVPFGPPPEEYNYRCSQCRDETLFLFLSTELVHCHRGTNILHIEWQPPGGAYRCQLFSQKNRLEKTAAIPAILFRDCATEEAQVSHLL